MLAYILALTVGLGSFAMYMAAFFFPEVHRKNDFYWSGVGLFYALALWACAGRITGGVLLGQVASVSLIGWLGWQTFNLRHEQTSPQEKTEISPEVEEKIQGFSLTKLAQPLTERVSGLLRRQPQTGTTTTVETTSSAVKTVESQKAPQTPTEPTASSPTVTIIDNTTSPTAPALQETTPTVEETATVETAIDNTTSPTAPAPEETTPTVEETATVETDVTTGDTEMSESPELVRPEAPDAELVEDAQPHEGKAVRIPAEEIAPESELAPPAEDPGVGDVKDRQAKTELPPSTPSPSTEGDHPPEQA
ncbi:MAG: hypothetical protein KME06_03495 [Kastovskya adunca ATA6-11-RM4]|jgi:hypothetical protein|nr:hypothetical protein [Kastovskya adunca ATA6-11-RM4]